MSDCFGVDIGGSGIKGAPVDLARGELTLKRKRIKTPQPATPAAVADVVAQLIEHFEFRGPIGCALPSVVQRGVVRSAANIDDSWIGIKGEKLFSERLGQRVHLLNDADAAGIAEMEFGAGRDEAGLVLMLTFGTGIGSALFYKGELIPNTELGHAEFRGMEAEEYAAGRLVEREDMKIGWWASRVNELLEHFEALFSPDLIIFGGGISKRFKEFEKHLETHARLEPAELRNEAGIVGAAFAARKLS